MEAYDQEQRDLIKPVEKKEEKKRQSGRDILEARSKRSVEEAESILTKRSDQDPQSEDRNCLNDPFCDYKFIRDPVRNGLRL